MGNQTSDVSISSDYIEYPINNYIDTTANIIGIANSRSMDMDKHAGHSESVSSGSKIICNKYLEHKEDISEILNDIRITNINRLIIGSLNVNSISNKFDQLKTVVQGKLDILVIVETKFDTTFPDSQFLITGYSTPYRLDRNGNGGGILIYVREDIPIKKLSKHSFPKDIEGLFIEINLRKTKWLIFSS